MAVSGGVRSFAGDGAREVGYELGLSGAGVSAGDGVGGVGYVRGGAGDWLAMACCGVVVGQAVVLAVWGRAGVPGAVAAGAVGATPGEAGLGCCPGVNVWPEGFSWALPCG